MAERSKDGVLWLASVVAKDAALLSGFPEETVEDFRGRIQSALESDEADGELREALIQLANATGVSIPEVNKDAEQD